MGVVLPDRVGVDVLGVMADLGVPAESLDVGVLDRGT